MHKTGLLESGSSLADVEIGVQTKGHFICGQQQLHPTAATSNFKHGKCYTKWLDQAWLLARTASRGAFLVLVGLRCCSRYCSWSCRATPSPAYTWFRNGSHSPRLDQQHHIDRLTWNVTNPESIPRVLDYIHGTPCWHRTFQGIQS